MQLAGTHPARQLGGSALAEVGALVALGAGRKLAVEEDGDAERGDPLSGLAGGRHRCLVAIVQLPDDRADIEGADVRVQALMGAEVDQVDGVGGARHQRLDELGRLGRHREDAAVVLGVVVAVENSGVCAQGRLQGADHADVPALGEVRDSDERHLAAHGISSSPSRTIASPSSSSVGFMTTQSR